MFRSIAAVALSALLLGTSAATQVYDAIENGFEIAVVDLTLPDGAGGNVTFRTCDSCPIASHRMTETTTFSYNGQLLAYPDFLQSVNNARRSPTLRQSASAGVFVDVNTKRVTRISVFARGQ